MRRTTRTTAAALVTLALIAAGSPGTLLATNFPNFQDLDDLWNHIRESVTPQQCEEAWQASTAAQTQRCEADVDALSSDECFIEAECSDGDPQNPSTIWNMVTGTLEEIEKLRNCRGHLYVECPLHVFD